MKLTFGAALVAASLLGDVAAKRPAGAMKPKPKIMPRQLPADPTNVKTIISPSGVNITYKATNEICETTPGVNSYSGFVNLAPDVHGFFWFFEARSDPANKPITLWLNGGPGSDSLIGLLQELGPCNVTQNLTTMLNPYSWTEVSNVIFLSQPVGVGFSYSGQAPGSLDPTFGEYIPDPVTGRYPTIYAQAINTTQLAAVAAWNVIQGFLSGLPQLDSNVTSKTFNLATESYGGHYGPAFFEYFYEQNQLIANGSANGTHLEMESLTIINGIIDEYVQAPYYPKFAVNNTYGIKAVNESVYQYMEYATYNPNGCLGQIELCYAANTSTYTGQAICAEAALMCRDNVESPYYYVDNARGVYDIRAPIADPTPPDYLIDFLNLASTQEALGVRTNYSAYSNTDIYYAFQQTGDFIYPMFLDDLNMILNNSVRVSLIYGDADYICNWFGGEAVSLATNYTYTAQFNNANYTAMTVDGVEYGESREYGLFSFTRVYEAGHEVPYYQPIAALALFNRTINGFDVASGTMKVSATSPDSAGSPQATHTESYVALPSTTSAVSSASAAAAGFAGRLKYGSNWRM